MKFLTNPKIAASTIGQKTSFLKDKGLTQSEIESALAQARLAAPTGTVATSNGGAYVQTGANNGMVMAGGGNQLGGGVGAAGAEQPAWGWKEYFIAATVMTGAVVVVKDYVMPKLQGYV